MNDVLTHQLDHTMEKDAKKKNRLKKLHPSVLKLLLFASAEDANTVPPEVSDTCERFINSETEGLADLELNSQFKSQNLPDVAFSVGFTQALYKGRFQWSDPSAPSNFSPFSMFKEEPIQAAEQQSRHYMLHLVQTQGKGRTLEEIKVSSKQIVKAPTTYLKLIQQMKFFAGACNIFLETTVQLPVVLSH